MRRLACLFALMAAFPGWAQIWGQTAGDSRPEAEYYLRAYAEHYRVPLEFARALVEQESSWQKCVASAKGAVGLMQLMPDTARRFNVQDRCNLEQSVSGGIRYLAWLMQRFHGDLRLVAAAYYAGEGVIQSRGLKYSNPRVVSYVASIRERLRHPKQYQSAISHRTPGRPR